MRAFAIAAAVSGAVLLTAAATQALADAEAGVPLTPAEAAGAWTLQADGHGICQITLGQGRAMPSAYAARASRSCGDALPGQVAGWTPTRDGMALVRPDGQTLISFGRWSNSLFVAHRSGGEDVQLRRGAPRSAANDQ